MLIPVSEDELNAEASRLVKSMLSRRQLRHADLVRALLVIGVEETVSSIKGKLHRGTFSFAWTIGCCKALGINKIIIDEE